MNRLLAGLLLCFGVCSAESAQQQIVEALHSGNPEKAEQLSSAELQSSKPSASLWALNGIAHVQLRDAEAGLASFHKALQVDPNYLPALEGAAQILYGRNSQDAVPLLRRIADRRPSDPTSHAMLASLAYQRKDCASAISEFSYAGALIHSDSAALREEASCLLQLHKPEDALPLFEQVFAASPDDPKSRYELAIAELAATHPEKAREVLGPLTTDSPPDSQALNLAAQSYEMEGNTADAIRVLRQAIISNPDLIANYLDFASLALIHRSAAVGIDVISIGLQRLPQAAPLYIARGILYVQLGQYDKSDEDFLTAEKLDPSTTDAPVALGMKALQTSDLPKAEAELRSRIPRQPKNAQLYYLLGETLLRRGAAPGSPDFKEALTVTEKACVLDPKLESARDLLGRLYLENGQINEAIEQSRLAVKENPNDQSALYHLILALKRSDHAMDLPALTRRLADLRAAALKRESDERKFEIVEGRE